MKKSLSTLLLLLYSLVLLAQAPQTLYWSGYPGNVAQKTITLDPGWTGTVTLIAYTAAGGRSVAASSQPTFTREGNTIYAQFSASATRSLSSSTYVELSTGGVVRYKGYLVLSYNGSVQNNPATPSLIITPDLVQGLNGILSAKADTALFVRRVPGARLITSDEITKLANSDGVASAQLDVKITYVSSIASLTALGRGNVTSVKVTDPVRGGDFRNYATGYTPNGGTVFLAVDGTFWVRQLPTPGTVHPGWWGALGNGSTETPDALQAAIDYGATLGQATVQLQQSYLLGSVNYSGTTTLLRLQPNVKLMGATGGTLIKAAPNSFTATSVYTNILAYNIGRGYTSSYNQNIHIENVTFDANGANQTSNTIFGIIVQRAVNTTLRNVTVKNTPGTGSGPGTGVESFSILFNVCQGVLVERCKAVADSAFASASGIGDAFSTDIRYVNSEVNGMRAMGFASYYSSNVQYDNCSAFYCQTNSFNEEYCTDIQYNRCVAGVETIRALGDGFESLGGPMKLNAKRARIGNPFGTKTYGFRLLNTSGGDNITLTNCIARNFSDNTTNAGIAITGVPDQVTVTAVNSTTVTVNAPIFTKHHIGRRIFLFGQFYQIADFISSTTVVFTYATNSPTGQTLTMGGANITIQGGDFSNNDYNITFQESQTGLNRYSARMTRITKDTKVQPSAGVARWFNINNVGPNNKISLGFNLPVDAFSSTFNGSNQPSVPSAGNRIFNDFPYDVRVLMAAGTGVTAAVNPGTYATPTAFGSFPSGVWFTIPARGFVILTYTTAPTWEWWAE